MSDFKLDVCVTHWTILRAWRLDPGALFGFKPCEEDGEHEIVLFVRVPTHNNQDGL